MTKKQLITYLPFAMMLLFLIGMSLFFFYYSPEHIIGLLGIENAYLLMFILSFAGGLSTFSGVPYHLVLIALASGGLNPLLLGLATAVGVIIGDATSYYIGYEGKEVIPTGIQKILQKLINFFMKHERFLPIFFLLYGSLAPFSNDFIVISMGYARYSFWKVMIPLGIGNLIFNTLLAFLSIYAYGFVQSIFL